MKHIVLAKKSSRILSGLIDFVILMVTTIITFVFLVYPFVFDSTSYIANGKEIAKLYEQSSLFLAGDEGSFASKVLFYEDIKTIDDLNNLTIKYEDKEYKDINLSKDLYTFYTDRYSKYDAQENISKEVYYSDVLKVGTETSNIASVNEENFAIKMIDDTKSVTTIAFFIDAFESASNLVSESSAITNLQNKNSSLMISSLLLVIPVLIGYGFIFNLLIPLVSKENQTIGKYIFKLGVLDQYGYKLKKPKLILRFLVYIFVEVLLGIITFGGVFLISYTMFMFAKKRRCLHDMAAGTVVVDLNQTIYFDNPQEEAYYAEKSLKFDE